MVMTATDTTNASTFMQDLWSKLTADSREENLLFSGLLDRRYEEEAGAQPYDVINIQSVGNFTVGATLSAGGSLTHAAATYNAQVVLTIDTHAYRSFDIETEFELMSNINQMEKLSHKAGYAVALKVDDDAAGLVDDFSQTVGVLAVALSFDDVLKAKRILDDAIAPEDSRYFVMAPLQQSEFMKDERVINNSYAKSVGSIENGAGRGKFAHIAGFDWYMTGNVEGSNAAGHDNGFWQKEAAALAIIDNMRTVSMYEIDTDSTKVAVHSIYGLKEIRDDHGVWGKGS